MDEFCSSPRQICPPSAGLSSTTSTDAPLSTAQIAAAMPAGPPPTTTISQVCLLIGRNLHARSAKQLTALYVRYSVHRHSAFEADAHPTQGTTCLACDGWTTARNSSPQNGSGHCSAQRYCEGLPIHRKRNRLRHKYAPAHHATEDKVQLGLQSDVQESDQPAVSLLPARW